MDPGRSTGTRTNLRRPHRHRSSVPATALHLTRTAQWRHRPAITSGSTTTRASGGQDRSWVGPDLRSPGHSGDALGHHRRAWAWSIRGHWSLRVETEGHARRRRMHHSAKLRPLTALGASASVKLTPAVDRWQQAQKLKSGASGEDRRNGLTSVATTAGFNPPSGQLRYDHLGGFAGGVGSSVRTNNRSGTVLKGDSGAEFDRCPAWCGGNETVPHIVEMRKLRSPVKATLGLGGGRPSSFIPGVILIGRLGTVLCALLVSWLCAVGGLARRFRVCGRSLRGIRVWKDPSGTSIIWAGFKSSPLGPQRQRNTPILCLDRAQDAGGSEKLFL